MRLSGIDTPERGQPFGTKASQAISELVFGKTVAVDSSGEDRYGRTVGTIQAEGANVNEALARKGKAWWHERYAPDDTALRDAQADARQARRRADPNPVPPWEWWGHGQGSQGPVCGAVDWCPMGEPQTASELIFVGEQSPQGGFTARAVGVSIFTQGDTLDALRANIREAVACYYGDGRQPPVIRLRIVTGKCCGSTGEAATEYRNWPASADEKRYECYALQSARQSVSCLPNG